MYVHNCVDEIASRVWTAQRRCMAIACVELSSTRSYEVVTSPTHASVRIHVAYVDEKSRVMTHPRLTPCSLLGWNPSHRSHHPCSSGTNQKQMPMVSYLYPLYDTGLDSINLHELVLISEGFAFFVGVSWHQCHWGSCVPAAHPILPLSSEETRRQSLSWRTMGLVCWSFLAMGDPHQSTTTTVDVGCVRGGVWFSGWAVVHRMLLVAKAQDSLRWRIFQIYGASVLAWACRGAWQCSANRGLRQQGGWRTFF
jgi:hypothetical protein